MRERVARFNADPSRLVNIVLRMAEAPVDPFGPAYQAIANGEYLADNGQAAAVIDASCTFVVGLVTSAVQPQCFFFFLTTSLLPMPPAIRPPPLPVQDTFDVQKVLSRYQTAHLGVFVSLCL